MGKEVYELMKKVFVTVLVAILMLGTYMRLVAAASPLYAVISADDEHEPEEIDDLEEQEENENVDEEDVEDEEEPADEEDVEAGEDEEDETDDEDEGSDDVDDVDGDEDDDDEDESDDFEDNDEDGVDDEKEDEEKRKLENDSSETKVKVESEIETEDMENEIEIEFMAEEGVTMELKYKNETETGDEEIDAELELKVRFMNLVEYFDNDTSGSLTEGDKIFQTLDLEELSYTPPQVATITSTDGEAGYRFELIGTLDDFEFNITAVLFSTYALVTHDSKPTIVSPTETKITINITNFPFNETTSALALQVKAVSETEIKTESETLENEIKAKSETAEGYFSWEAWAIVNGVKRENAVNHSITSHEDDTVINLCYPQGSKIFHDPKLGVSIELAALTQVFTLITPELLIGTGITAIAVTVAAIALSRREKGISAGFAPFA